LPLELSARRLGATPASGHELPLSAGTLEGDLASEAIRRGTFLYNLPDRRLEVCGDGAVVHALGAVPHGAPRRRGKGIAAHRKHGTVGKKQVRRGYKKTYHDCSERIDLILKIAGRLCGDSNLRPTD
jgi:hypothetical protein